MNNFFVILAAGNSKRFKSKYKKQYILYRNLRLFEHSILKALDSKLFKKIILVVDNPKKLKKTIQRTLLL